MWGARTKSRRCTIKGEVENSCLLPRSSLLYPRKREFVGNWFGRRYSGNVGVSVDTMNHAERYLRNIAFFMDQQRTVCIVCRRKCSELGRESEYTIHERRDIMDISGLLNPAHRENSRFVNVRQSRQSLFVMAVNLGNIHSEGRCRRKDDVLRRLVLVRRVSKHPKRQ